MKLCEWCEQPVQGDNELCPKCLDAQARVEAGQLIPAEQTKKNTLPETLAGQIGSVLIFIGKGVVALALGWLMICSALLGTCLVLGTFGTFIYAPLWSVVYLLGAVLAFYVSYLIYGLTKKMYERPLRPINRSKDSPPTIERKD